MNKAERDAAYYQRNKERIKAQANAYYHANAEMQLAKQKARYQENKPEKQAANTAWAIANKQKMLDYHREYVKRNRAKWSAQTALYRATKKQATPAWADLAEIRKFYNEAKAAKDATGKEHHVDHIVPLQSDTVCGLHVAANLQVLLGRTNRIKSNSFWPDMPEKETQ